MSCEIVNQKSEMNYQPPSLVNQPGEYGHQLTSQRFQQHLHIKLPTKNVNQPHAHLIISEIPILDRTKSF